MAKRPTKNRIERPPSLDALYVFAVSGRHLSFTGAAAELHRTQSAVSHRIKALERQIGVRLFNRGPRGLELTVAGDAIAHQVNQSILDIMRTIGSVGSARSVQKLRVTMLPSVASRWLMPRLSTFQRRFPNIQVQVIADSRVLDLQVERIDLAIRFGHGRYRRHTTTPMMKDWALPVCSPRLLAGREAIERIEMLFELPLLHDAGAEGDGSLSDWKSWLDQLGRADIACHEGQRFSHAGLLVEAAVHGLGVALARLSLVMDHLTSGALISPFPKITPTAYRYYLVTLPERTQSAAVALFVEWLQREAMEMNSILARLKE